VATALNAGRDARRLGEALLSHLRDILLAVLAPGSVALPDAALERAADQGRRLGSPATVRAMDVLGEALLAMREAPDPRVVLEVALVRATRPELDPSPAALLERVERLERGHRPASRPPAGETPASPPPAPRLPAPRPAGPTPAPAPPPGPPRASGELPSRDELTVAWADAVLSTLRPRAKGLFAGGRFVEVGDAAVFALPSEALRLKADGMRAEVEQALGDHFGRGVPLRLVVDGPDHRTPTPTTLPEDEASVDLAELRDAPADRRSGIDRLTEAFPGSEIVDG
jgi:DNA polymerase III subunit gamma/tau